MYFLQTFHSVIGNMDIELVFPAEALSTGKGLCYLPPTEGSVMKRRFPVLLPYRLRIWHLQQDLVLPKQGLSLYLPHRSLLPTGGNVLIHQNVPQ